MTSMTSSSDGIFKLTQRVSSDLISYTVGATYCVVSVVSPSTCRRCASIVSFLTVALDKLTDCPHYLGPRKPW